MLEVQREEIQPIANSQQQENQEQQNTRNKQLLIIIVAYLLLTLANRMSFIGSSSFKDRIASQMKKTADNTTTQFLRIIDLIDEETLEGVWERSDTVASQYLDQPNGIFSVKFQRVKKKNAKLDFTITLTLKNGQYIDNGVLQTKIYFKPQNYISRIRQFPEKNIREYKFDLNTTNPVSMTHRFSKIFNNIYENLDTPLKQFSMLLKRQSQNFEFGMRLSTLPPFLYKMEILNNDEIYQQDSDEFRYDKYSDIINLVNNAQIKNQYPYQFFFQIQNSQSKIIPSLILSILLGFIAYCEVSTILEILVDVGSRIKTVQHLSTLTILIVTMWDQAFCFISFQQIFNNGQQALVLFIFQSFAFIFLAINLQIRLVYHIFENRIGQANFQPHIFKFHVIAYGCLLLVYPIVMFTNLNSYLFISACTLFIPQIICNGYYKVKPEPNDPYYKMFLLPRFVFIFYLKANPWNIYGLKPDFMLIFICSIIVGFQMLGLWAQKVYHPRIIVPKIFLPPIYNYSCDEQLKQDDGSDITRLEASPRECAICLNKLNKDNSNSSTKESSSNSGANSNSSDSVNSSSEVCKLMKTPCGHKYHGTCLVQWMKIKKECPLCRTHLPPFQ